MKTLPLTEVALAGLRFDLPDDPIGADLGDGPAYTVHLLPNVIACERVVFVAKDTDMDNEGYWVHLDRLREEEHWPAHLAEKRVSPGCRPAVVMLAEAIARKRREPSRERASDAPQ